MNIKEIHIVSNTHWDREFRFSFQKTRMMLVNMIDELLALLEKDKNYASFMMDSHSILIEDYLQIRPENKERIKHLVKNKRLFIGPWYTLPDIPNVGAESVVRNLIFGHKIGKEFGHTMKAGYTPCSWGQISQLPQIYSEFEIDSALFYRGISPHETTSEFIWEAADGTQILGHRFALFARYNYYYLVFRKITYGLDYNDRAWIWGKDGETPFKISNIPEAVTAGVELLQPDVRYIKENLKPAFEEMLNIEAPHYAGPIFLAMHGHDISFAHPLESTVNKDSEQLFKDIKVIHSNLENYVKKVKKCLDLSKIPILKGERRTNLKNGLWTYLLPATLSARTPLKVLDTKTENLLARLAEPISILKKVVCGSSYPSEYINLAWRYFLSNHTHDANAGCAPDNIINDVIYRLRQTSEIANGVVEDAIKTIAQKIDTKDQSHSDVILLLVNPLPYQKTDVLDLIVDMPADVNAKSLCIKDFNGNELQHVITKVEEGGSFVDNKWNVPQTYLTKRFYLKVFAQDIPSCGYQSYLIAPSEDIQRRNDSLVTAPNEMENEFFKVKINQNGTMNILNKTDNKSYESLGYFLDQGEVGNAWRHQSPNYDSVITSLSMNVVISKIEDTPFSASFKIDLELFLPEECPDETRRSSNMIKFPITQIVTLKKGVKRIELITRFENNVKDHWFRMVFPVAVETKISKADSHFDVVEREIAVPACSGWREPAVGTYPMYSFVNLSDDSGGLSVLVEGLKEYEILREKIPAIAISLVRGVRIKLEVAENRKQEIPDVGSQCPGVLEFRTAIVPHSSKLNPAEAIKEAVLFNNQIKAAQFGKNKNGNLPKTYSLFTLQKNNISVTAIKKSEFRNSFILRFFNPAKEEISDIIKFFIPIKKVWQTTLNEKRISEIPLEKNGKIKIKVKPKKIVTLEIEV